MHYAAGVVTKADYSLIIPTLLDDRERGGGNGGEMLRFDNGVHTGERRRIGENYCLNFSALLFMPARPPARFLLPRIPGPC